MGRKSSRPPGWEPYKIDGEEVPSATTVWGEVVASSDLMRWMVRDDVVYWRAAYVQAFHELQYAGDGAGIRFSLRAQELFKDIRANRLDPAVIGTLVHKAIEADLWGDPVPELPEEARPAFEHYREWRRQHTVVPFGLELRVHSRTHQYAGTIDFVGLIDDVFTVADFKTGAHVWLDHLVQIAAYRHALRETLDFPVEAHGLVLRFPQDQPKAEIRSVPWHEQDRLMELFVAARTLYDPVTKPLWKAA